MQGPLRLLLVVPLFAALLAGCLDPDTTGPGALRTYDPLGHAADTLQAGSFYAFDHDGSALRFSANHTDGSRAVAQIDLYGPTDDRVAGFRLDSDDPLLRNRTLVDLPRGELVLHTRILDGTLDVRRSDGPLDRFYPLQVQFDRHLLAQQPISEDFFGFTQPDPQPVDEALTLELGRAPAELRLYATHRFYDMSVQVLDDLGPVLEYTGTRDDSRSTPLLGPSTHDWRIIEADLYAQNSRSGTLRVTVTASHLEGPLMLEAWSYSRARATIDVLPVSNAPPPGFAYDELPARPVWFNLTTDRTSLIYLESLQSSGDPAWVTLYDPDDRKMGSYPVPTGQTIAVPISQSGGYVAMLLSGKVRLALDAPSVDVQFNPMQIQTSLAPEPTQSGPGDGYRQGRQDIQTVGAPFAARPISYFSDFDFTNVDFLFGCQQDTTVRLLQNGESLAFAGNDVVAPGSDPEQTFFAVGHLLDRTPLEVAFDDFGRNDCGHYVLEIQSYVRPGQAS